jgi:hypothetical protein
MNSRTLFSLLLVIIAGATIANLIALKIASDQIQKSASGNSLLKGLLGSSS